MVKEFSFLGFLERVGNLLPHPAMIFVYLTILLFISSAVASYFELSVIFNEKEIVIKNLMSFESFVGFTSNFVNNFAKFPPLAVVLVAMLGISVAEYSGFLKTGIKLLVLKAPKTLVSFFIVLTGVLSNIASDVGYVVLIPPCSNGFSLHRKTPFSWACSRFCRR